MQRPEEEAFTFTPESAIQCNTFSSRTLRKQRAHQHCKEACQEEVESKVRQTVLILTYIKAKGRMVWGQTELAQPVTGVWPWADDLVFLSLRHPVFGSITWD